MSVPFPSREFFETLRQRIADDPAIMVKVDPSEAYCGLAVGDDLYVMEFDGRGVAAVAFGGNPLDLDFVLEGSRETWRETISAIGDHVGADANHTLAALVRSGAIKIRSENDEGPELASAALDFLQAFLDQAQHVDVSFG